MTELERLARAIAPVAWEPSRYFNSATRCWNRQNSLIAAQAALAHWTPKRIATMTDKPDPDAIEARCNAATEGPYQARWLPEGMPADPCRFGVISEATGKEVARCWDQQDAEFYFNARTDIPALIAELRKAWEDNETLLREHNHALAVIREAS